MATHFPLLSYTALTFSPGFFVNPTMSAFQKCMVEIVRPNGTGHPGWLIVYTV